MFVLRGRVLRRRSRDLEAQLEERQRNQVEREALLEREQASLARLRGIMSSVGDGIALIDGEGRVVLQNDASQELLPAVTRTKYDGAITSLGGRPLDELIADVDSSVWQDVEGSEHNGTRRTYAVALRRVHATVRDGNHVIVVRDISDERRLQEEAASKTRLASLGQLAAGVAHDFNNALMVIQANADLLAAQHGENHLVDSISSQVSVAADLTSRVLDYGRQSVTTLRPMNLATFLREEQTSLEQLLPDGVTLDLSIDDEPCWIVADANQQRSVLSNLVLNAAAAMPDAGSVAVSIAGAPAPGGENSDARSVVLDVTDTGLGMDEETLGRAFEPFFTTKGVGQGTGLGLAQVDGIVTQHGGHVIIESEVGQGTRVILRYPSTDLRPGTNQEKAAPLVVPSHAPTAATLLIVEDQDALRDALVSGLSAQGFSVHQARDGMEGLEVFDHRTIDLVVTDVRMPRMTGTELLREVRQRNPDTPFVVLTGYLENAELAEVQRIAMSGDRSIEILAKPTDVSTLARSVRGLLQDHVGT